MAYASDKHITSFTKDGKTRLAYSPADAVALRFDGWVEEMPQAKPAAARTTAGTQTPKTDSGSGSR